MKKCLHLKKTKPQRRKAKPAPPARPKWQPDTRDALRARLAASQKPGMLGALAAFGK